MTIKHLLIVCVNFNHSCGGITSYLRRTKLTLTNFSTLKYSPSEKRTVPSSLQNHTTGILFISKMQLLGIFVFCYFWLTGMTNAAIVQNTEDPAMDALLELEMIQKEEDVFMHQLKIARGPDNKDFKIHKKVKSTNCGGSYHNSPGQISHPVSSKNYGNNEYCVWTVTSEVPLYFYFSKFNTEEQFDFITARDGLTVGSPEIGKYSGKSLETTFVTKGSAYITFESDENVIGRGFVLHWRIYTAEEQCNEKNGTCIITGDRCDGIIEIIENSCDDTCVCCIPL